MSICLQVFECMQNHPVSSYRINSVHSPCKTNIQPVFVLKLKTVWYTHLYAGRAVCSTWHLSYGMHPSWQSLRVGEKLLSGASEEVMAPLIPPVRG